MKNLHHFLQRPGFRFVDLQYGDTTQERAELRSELGIEVEHLVEIDNRDDLDGHAAPIAACDAVFTVSNTSAHMAGVLGTPAWVMLPFDRARFWYCFADSLTSPWYTYPEMSRQKFGQFWAELLAELKPEIEQLAALTRRPPM